VPGVKMDRGLVKLSPDEVRGKRRCGGRDSILWHWEALRKPEKSGKKDRDLLSTDLTPGTNSRKILPHHHFSYIFREMADFLLVIRKTTKTGNFANTDLTSMRGDTCLIYLLGFTPGTGEQWRNGRYGYAVVRNVSEAFIMEFKKPGYHKTLVDGDGKPLLIKKRRYKFSDLYVSTLSEDFNKPTELAVIGSEVQDKDGD